MLLSGFSLKGDGRLSVQFGFKARLKSVCNGLLYQVSKKEDLEDLLKCTSGERPSGDASASGGFSDIKLEDIFVRPSSSLHPTQEGKTKVFNLPDGREVGPHDAAIVFEGRTKTPYLLTDEDFEKWKANHPEGLLESLIHKLIAPFLRKGLG
jgi:hypothetical protein